MKKVKFFKEKKCIFKMGNVFYKKVINEKVPVFLSITITPNDSLNDKIHTLIRQKDIKYMRYETKTENFTVITKDNKKRRFYIKNSSAIEAINQYTNYSE